MTQDEIKQAVAQAHYDAYTAAIYAGNTPGQAMQIADAAAAAKRLELSGSSSTDSVAH